MLLKQPRNFKELSVMAIIIYWQRTYENFVAIAFVVLILKSFFKTTMNVKIFKEIPCMPKCCVLYITLHL